MQLGGMDVSSYKYLYCAAVTHTLFGGGGLFSFLRKLDHQSSWLPVQSVLKEGRCCLPHVLMRSAQNRASTL